MRRIRPQERITALGEEYDPRYEIQHKGITTPRWEYDFMRRTRPHGRNATLGRNTTPGMIYDIKILQPQEENATS